MPKIILHLKPDDETLVSFKGRRLGLYHAIQSLGAKYDIAVEVRRRDSDIRVGTRTVPDDRFADGNLHIIDDRSVHAKNVLNAGVAYFWEYWHLDPQGVKAFSSIGDIRYDPRSLGSGRVAAFCDRLRSRYQDQRLSKYGQPTALENFPTGAVSVFMQGDYPVASGASQYGDFDIIDAVLLGAGDRPIIIKPHPLATDALDISRLHKLAMHDNRLIITSANVQDILRSSCATVSANSTVALEGFLCGVPALLFGKSDFHHFAGTVKRPKAFAKVLARELPREGFDAYIAWYFIRNTLRIHSEDIEDQIWQKFEAAGFGKTVFGR